eukprot:scaffold48_cov311-Pinguiococcus_pyrenoidosus.AAC.264
MRKPDGPGGRPESSIYPDLKSSASSSSSKSFGEGALHEQGHRVRAGEPGQATRPVTLAKDPKRLLFVLSREDRVARLLAVAMENYCCGELVLPSQSASS